MASEAYWIGRTTPGWAHRYRAAIEHRTRTELLAQVATHPRVYSVIAGIDLAVLGGMAIRAPGFDWLPLCERLLAAQADPAQTEAALVKALDDIGPGLLPPRARLTASLDTYLPVGASAHRSIREALATQARLDAQGVPAAKRLEYLMGSDVVRVLRQMDPDYEERARTAVGVQSKRIDVRSYDVHELNHPGYTEMMVAVAKTMVEAARRNPRAPLVCIGPGPGIDAGFVSDHLARVLPGLEVRIICLEPDPVGFERLAYNMASRKNVSVVLARGEDYGRLATAAERLGGSCADRFPRHVAGVFGTFSFHHIKGDADVRTDFYRGPYAWLLPGGLLASGEEHLGEHDGTVEGTLEAIHAYHRGVVIDGERIAQDPAFVALEQQAEASGVMALDPDPSIAAGGCDFKGPASRDEKAMSNAGFDVRTYTVWTHPLPAASPFDTSGVLARPEARAYMDQEMRANGGIVVMVAEKPGSNAPFRPVAEEETPREAALSAG